MSIRALVCRRRHTSPRLLGIAVATLLFATSIPAAAAASPTPPADSTPTSVPTATPSATPTTTPAPTSSGAPRTPAAVPAHVKATSQPKTSADPVREKIATLLKQGGKGSVATSPTHNAVQQQATAQKPSRLGAPARLVVTPGEVTVTVGKAQAFTVAAFDASGNFLGDVTSSSQFSIDKTPGACQANVCTPLYVGDFQVVATEGSARGFAQFHVKPANVPAGSSSPTPALAATSATVAAPAVTSYHVSGRVTNQSGVGLAGIRVVFEGYSIEATTDGSGYFSVPVPPQWYAIRVEDPTGHHLMGWYDSNASGHYANNNQVPFWVQVVSADVTLLPIAMPDTNSLSGVVTDALGHPLAGMSVDALGANTWRWSTTDASGAFHLGLVAGSYRLHIHDDSKVYGDYYYATPTLTVASTSAVLVTVAGADVTVGSTALPARVHLSGRVTDESGGPLNGISVSASTQGVGGDWAETNANGDYTLRVDPNVGYIVGFSDGSGTHVSGYYFNGGFSLLGPSYGEESVAMHASDVDGIDVELPTAVHISGRVTDVSGKPLPSITVIPYLGDPMDGGRQLTFGFTDANGAYTLAVPANGAYFVEFACTSYTPSGEPLYAWGYYGIDGFTAIPEAAAAIAVGGQSITGINAVMPTYITLSGRVVDENGLPRAGVWVDAIFAGANSGYGSQTSDDSGNFSLRVAGGYEYVIRFWRQNGAGYPDIGYYDTNAGGNFAMPEALATPVSVRCTTVTGINVTLPTYHVIGGMVTAKSGYPLAGVEVLVFDPSDQTTYVNGLTNSMGVWSARVMPKTYALYFSDQTGTWASGYLGADGFVYDPADAKAISITNADDTGENVALPPPLHISGTVETSGGAAAVGLEVDIYDADSQALWDWATTDSNGAYSIVVVPGDYVVGTWDESLTDPNGYWTATGFTQDPLLAGTVGVTNRDVSIDIRFPIAHLLSGTVTDAYGSAAEGIEAWVFNSQGNPLMPMAATDQHGYYALLVLSGSYFVGYHDPGGMLASGFWDGDGFTANPDEAALVAVAADVPNLDVKIPSIPDAPTNAHAIRGDGSAKVTWSVPARDGGAAITSYVVYSLEDDNWCEWTSGPLTCTLTALTNGTTYTFLVFAVNVAGYGPDSDPSNSVIPAGLPFAPAGVSAGRGFASAYINWTASNSNGSPVTGYSVTSTPSSAGCTTTGTLSCAVSGLTNGVSYTFQVSATNGVGQGAGSAPSAPVVPGPATGTSYHPLAPTRMLDTRINLGLSGAFHSHVARGFQVTGGLVPATATAVTGNLTVTQQTSQGYLYVGPNSMDNPTSSTLNFPTADDRANAVTVALSSDGKLFVTFAAPTAAPTAHAIFDVTGYFTADATGATYHPLNPARILDSRDGTGGISTAFKSHLARSFPVRGFGGVPANATAVTGNLTVTQQTSLGYLSLGPVSMNNPTSSTLNFPKGDDRANAVTVALAGDGTLSITFAAPTAASTAQVIFDVTGYFTPDMSGAVYVPLTPSRILDTRDPTAGLGALTSHHSAGFAVWSRGGVPVDAVAITGNLTVTQQTSLGYLYLGPAPADNPASSNLNFPEGDDRANAVTVSLSGDGRLFVTYAAPTGPPTSHAILDVTGYFVH